MTRIPRSKAHIGLVASALLLLAPMVGTFPARAATASPATATAAPAAATAPPAGPTAAPAGDPIDNSQYTLLGFDSESPAYPAPPSLDGTAQGAFDGDYTTQWASAYNGGNPDKLPHWLTFDIGGSFDLTGLGYSVKVQNNGPVGSVDVYATNDRSVATAKDADWGDPVGTATFHQPTSNTEIQYVTFSEPVQARYVKFEATSAVNGTDNASASEIVVYSTDADTSPTPVDPAPPVHPAQPETITNGNGLSVKVDDNFPQVISYDWNGKTIGGQAEQLTSFRINGTEYTATSTGKTSGDQATYTSTFATFPNLTVTSTITATEENTVVFEMTDLSGSAAADVDMITIPNQSLVSVDSSDADAQLARTRISADSTTTADRFVAILGSTPADSAPVGTPYGFVSNSQLSAGIITNATDDAPQGSNDNGNSRLQSQIVAAGDHARRAELWVGNWTYAPKGATDQRVKIYALPKATVVLAADANDDGTVDWQDGAIAYRNNMTHPLGSARVPDRVVQHIPFNFASEATNPFLKTLDNVKRISMATDDLGQWVLEKGYQNEGHDSAHPDYGGNYNIRAGGKADLNTLVDDGAKYNADVAVHVNATEAYPQAKTFSDRMVQGQPNGWDWLNQSYHIDQRWDLGGGHILDRFQQLKKEVPNLAGVYIDVYLSSGWLADGLAQQLHKMGFGIATEYASRFEGNSIWSHWANDKNYGGATNKGINSNIIRFIANGDRDVWNIDPVLGGSEIVGFEGWTGHDDWNAFYRNIWVHNLPTKFLQHYAVQDWDFGKSATLSNGEDTVDVTVANNKRRIRMDGALIADGGAYLLPWGDPSTGNNTTSPSNASKMYYFNADSGAATTFDLTPQFDQNGSYVLYKLTDQGRVKVEDVAAVDGAVTITGTRGVPYVLAPKGATAPHAHAHYGEHSGLVDPGFNSGTLAPWNAKGGASIVRTDTGDNVARLGTAASSLSQELKTLKPGEQYTLSANVEIGPGAKRATTLSVTGAGVDAANSFDSTPQRNRVAADAKKGTYSQRAQVTFVAPKQGTVMAMISAVKGAADVTIDDVRVMASTLDWSPTTGKTQVNGGTLIADNDFEGNQPGWGPFVKGDAGGTTDPRTSFSDLHAPYTQKKWKNAHSPYDSGSLEGKAIDDVLDGHHSLKSHEENTGLVYRTVPATVPFVAGHQYRVSFKYQSNVKGQWAWVTGADTIVGGKTTSKDVTDTAIAPALETSEFSQDIVAGCGDTWVGLRKTGGARGTDFVIDDFTVTDMGEADGGAACASVSAPASASVSPGVASRVTTTFTNNESGDATNVGLRLANVPEGWSVKTVKKNGNLFDTVKGGQTVKTTWLITAPADAKNASADLKVEAAYFNTCATKTVSTGLAVSVAEKPMLSPSTMTATADSQNATTGSEGPASNVLDEDTSTIWHTQYSPTVVDYPHWITLKLDTATEVSSLGYQDRLTGGDNGKVKDYTVSVSTDGTSWTDVASGHLVKSPDMQVISFAPVTALYVKFTATSAINGLPFASAAEMRVYGTPRNVPTGYAPAARPADDGDCGASSVDTAVRLVDSRGDPLAGGVASYYADGSWHRIGTTDDTGVVTAHVAPGSYSFAMTYRGTRQQLNGQKVSGATSTVAFRTALVNVELQGSDSNGHVGTVLDIPGRGSASYYADGSYHKVSAKNPNNPKMVQAQMLPGSYTFAATYRGTRDTKKVTIVEPDSDSGAHAVQTVYFHAALVNVELQGYDGGIVPLDSASYYAGSWRDVATENANNSKIVQAQMLPGTYSFAAKYHGTRDQKKFTVAEPNPNNGEHANQTVYFHAALVNVQMQSLDDEGHVDGIVSGDASYYAGGWHPVTGVNPNNPNIVRTQMLPGTYSFAAVHGGSRMQKKQTVVEPNPNNGAHAKQIVYFNFVGSGAAGN